MDAFIITDSMDLNRERGLSKDDFYSEKRNSGVKSDSKAGSKISNGTNTYYALLSISDKEINNRTYDKKSWKKTVEDGAWLKPYPRPILRNHDLYYSEPVGRIKNAYFVDFRTNDVTSSTTDKLPADVLKNYKDSGAFEKGTGAVIVEFTADEETGARIESGLDMTVSQSSFMKGFKCNVCGNDFYSDDCQHRAGKTYQVGDSENQKSLKCIPVASDFDPIELSIVNIPANDVSTIFVKSLKKAGAGSDSVNGGTITFTAAEPKFDDAANQCENTTIEIKEDKAMEVQDKLFKKIAKDYYVKMLSENIKMDDSVLESFDKLFETITADQIELFGSFIESVKKLEDSKEPETPTEEPVVENPAADNQAEPEPVTEPEPVAEPEPVTEPEPVAEPEPEPVTEPESDSGKGNELKGLFNDAEKPKQKYADKIEDKELLALLNIKF